MDNSEFDKILKTSNQELTGWIIEKANEVENLINTEIYKFVEPKNEFEFYGIILNSSIINMGGKQKILRNIKDFDANIIDDIRELYTIRNQFAHATIREEINLMVSDEKKSTKHIIPRQIKYMNSKGKVMSVDPNYLIKKFYDYYKIITGYLKNRKTATNK